LRGSNDGLPDRIGQYLLIDQIGAGGMGRVYEAKDTVLGGSVALKVLRVGKASPATVGQLVAEARLLRRAAHTYVATVHTVDCVETPQGPLPYIAMELVAGGHRLDDRRLLTQLSLRQRVRVMAQVCEAVHAAHQRGVIHADLKPSNILVSLSDGVATPKVIDFGLSGLVRSLGSAGDRPRGGTPGYMSPELIARGGEGPDELSDVFALGATLYQVLCGALADGPWDSEHGKGCTPPHRLNPQVSGRLEQAILAALTGDPSQRTQSAGDLASQLESWSSDVWHQRRELLMGWARRNVAATLLLSGLIAALLANTVGTRVLFEWTTAAAFFEKPLGTLADSSNELQHVRIVALRDDASLLAAAQAAGLEGVNPSTDVQTLRRLHGRLAEQVAVAGAALVVWDVFFEEASSDPANDVALIAGLRALRASGAEVVLATKTWYRDESGAPLLSRNLLASQTASWGAACLIGGNGKPYAELAVQRKGEIALPSLSLMAYSIYSNRGWEPSLTIDDRTNMITQRLHRQPDPQSPWARVWMDAPSALPSGAVQPIDHDDLAYGVRRGDLQAVMPIIVPADSIISKASHDAAQVLAATPDQLRGWFGDKVVVIGDQRPGRDEIVFAGDRPLLGFQLHAALIDQLIDGRPILFPGSSGAWLATLAASALGIIGAVIGRRGSRRLGPGAGVAMSAGLLIIPPLLVIVICAWMLHSLRYMCSPAVPVVASVLAGLFGIAVLRLTGGATRERGLV